MAWVECELRDLSAAYNFNLCAYIFGSTVICLEQTRDNGLELNVSNYVLACNYTSASSPNCASIHECVPKSRAKYFPLSNEINDNYFEN